MSQYQALRAALEPIHQGHLLEHLTSLEGDTRERFEAELHAIDWAEAGRLIRTHVQQRPEFPAPQRVEPAPMYPALPTPDLEPRYAEARRLGESLLRAGRVAVFTVAGGQGTRLGYDGPKGCYPATPLRGAPLFQVFAEALIKAGQKYGVTPPWYVMTSPLNHGATVAFFEQQAWFGLDPAAVHVFPQAMMPAMDADTGRVLLAGEGRLALSPNGHGGSLKALHTSGALADMRRRGVEHVSYIQVDNPLVKPIDPLFIGLHASDNSEMSSKALAKREPLEKVGNFCIADGQLTVIEYSNMPDALAQQRDPDGGLAYNAGSIAIHLIAVDFVERLNTSPGGFALPWNRADKKVPHFDPQTGKTVRPDTPNAVKLETFVFDAIPLSRQAIVLETLREEEFAPIKNADGADGVEVDDSPASSKRLQAQRGRRWLEAGGHAVDADATVELTHLAAISTDDTSGLTLDQPVRDGTVV